MIQFQNAIDYYTNFILKDLPDGCWVAGGSVRNFFTGENPKKSDIDIFFESESAYKVSLEQLQKKGKLVYDNPRVTRIKYKRVDIDLVKIWFENPQSCIEAFDFTVSMLAVDKIRVYHGDTTFIDLAKRQIMLNPLCKFELPLSVLNRIIKYTRKGYYICKGEQRKMYDIIQKSKVNSEDQLISGYEIIGFD